MMNKILVNKVKCKKCGDIIQSKAVNDFKRCSCKSIAIDGGTEYLKRIGNFQDFEELSVYDEYHRKGVKIPDTKEFKIVQNALLKSDVFNKNNPCCSFCGSSDIHFLKGDGERIIGDDFIAVICNNCKKIYEFKDIKYRK